MLNSKAVKVEEEEKISSESATGTDATGSGDADKVRTELSVMEKLLMPAAKVLAMDATDSVAGDGLVKEKVIPINPMGSSSMF